MLIYGEQHAIYCLIHIDKKRKSPGYTVAPILIMLASMTNAPKIR